MNCYDVQQGGDESVFGSFLHGASFPTRAQYNIYFKLFFIPFAYMLCLLKSVEGKRGATKGQYHKRW